jgi:translation initiation factor IF-3
MGQVEMEPKLMGKSINMTMSPLPIAKRKRKFTVEDEELPPDPAESPESEE